MNHIAELEKYRAAHKSHAVEISVDDGYGAACWSVQLWRGKHYIYAAEVSFFEGPDRSEEDGNVCVSLPESDDWPGLGPTIELALREARAHFGLDEDYNKL